MNKVIEQYYISAKTNPFLLKQKSIKLDKHKDIAMEFEDWITTGKYKTDNCAEVEGYSASSLAQQYKILDGEAAFMLLIELRENPKKAFARMERGFKIK